MQDMFGQEYGVGDYVAYATTLSRTPVIKVGQVRELRVLTAEGFTRDQCGKLVPEGATFTKVGIWRISSTMYDSDTKALSFPNLKNIIKLDPDLIRFREDGQT